MKQEVLFPEFEVSPHSASKVVNVASIPQRSPFRYPGGKTWFVPTFRKWLSQMQAPPRLLIEPFVGGGIISLTALFEKLVERVVMVERDEAIAAVWQSVVNGDSEWLAEKILSFDLTKENVHRELECRYVDQKQIAFQTILKNRTYHGGILAEGSSLLKYGENGKGIRSRWYPKTLATRFRNIAFVASRIEFVCGDGLLVLQKHNDDEDTVFFIDPPYTAGGKKAGKRLYKFYDLDHKKLFEVCASLKGRFIMTYDMADEVRELARYHDFQCRPVAMKNTHHAEMKELVIGRDLSWMREA